MSTAPYRHEDVADGIAARIGAGALAVFTEAGDRRYGDTSSVLTVETDTGQLFRVTVEEDS